MHCMVFIFFFLEKFTVDELSPIIDTEFSSTWSSELLSTMGYKTLLHTLNFRLPKDYRIG